jgi:uncharacterized membrane protein
MIEDIVETLNWLTITVPFIAAGGFYAWLEARKVQKAVAVALAVFLLSGLWLLLFLIYQRTGFPLWMRWPSQLFGCPYFTR